MISAYYGKNYSLDTIREKCHISREGVSMLGISEAAESIGFRTSGVKISWNQLRDEAPLPCIVHWNQNHFVVVYRIMKSRKGCNVYVSDPAGGLLTYSEAQFLKSWSHSHVGMALLLEPTPQFYKNKDEDDRRLKFSYVFGYLKPFKSYLFQLFLAILTAALISFLLPFLTQSIVDVGIGSGSPSYILMILAAQVALNIGLLANNLIRSWLMLHMTTRMSISLISDFLAKLMRLPISFFDSRKVGDIMQRIGDYGRIQSFLTGTLLSMVMACMTLLIYSFIMTGYDPSILLIFLIGSILYVAWIVLFMRQRRKLDYKRFQEASKNQSNVVQLVTGMQEIKLNNCERQKRWEWERIQAKLFKISIKGLSLGQAQEIGGTFIDQFKNLVISFIAAKAVILGNMTIGMMMAMQYVIGQLNAPVSQFISFIQAYQDARISLERMGEILEKDDEEPTGSNRIRIIPDGADIRIENVVFQYEGPDSDKVLNDVSLTIKANQVTAIVGPSGSGKSTLLKIILGFYEPVSGSIILGDKPLKKYNAASWRQNCGVVLQEGFIFSDTIARNIALTEEQPDIERLRSATDLANISDFIDSLPLGFETIIGQEGHGLSSGQRQRLLIARAVYKNARYLILDEATNSLDANNERQIMKRLNDLFKNKTVIIAAHRLSTVKKADVIIVMDHGSVVERGRHEDLIKLHGKYYELIKNQLELGK
jgi:ATP-binding cassette subfamily B protein